MTWDADSSVDEGLVRYLEYCSYRQQRISAPHIAPARWRAVYVEADRLEREYQRECAARVPAREEACDDLP